MREDSLTYRTIGGSLDLYFLSGEEESRNNDGWWGWRGGESQSSSTALTVYRQYQAGCVGLPAMQMYWAFGFHQCHWGWQTIQDLETVVEKYANASVPLESIWTDIDLYDRFRVFTNDPERFPSAGMQDFIASLHSRGQHFVPLIDSNVYFPDPGNASDVYPPFERGAELSTFVRNSGTGNYYIGSVWPGPRCDPTTTT